MELRQLENLSVKLLNPDRDKKIPRSVIFQNAKPVGKDVSGAILEAAVQWREWYLLFLTDDCPFEDSLNIHLLDEQFNALDSVAMFWMYSTGVFKSLKLIQPNIVQFRFFGDSIWRVELLQKPTFRFPYFSEPLGVWRSLGFSRHFKVYGNPRPEGASL